MKLTGTLPPRWKRLFDVYDEFVKQISAMTSEEAIATADNWNKYKHQYEGFRSQGVPASALAEGIAQGLRETPESIQRFAPSDRASASAALHRAFELHFPEWLAKEAEAVRKIRDKKRVSSAGQFYLIVIRLISWKATPLSILYLQSFTTF